MIESNSETELKRDEIEIPSKGIRLRDVREFIERFSKKCGFSDPDVFDLKVAIGEACANAIEHGSPKGKANNIRINLSYKDSLLIAEVVDEGVFRPRFPSFNSQLNYRGRGIPFMLALMDEVEIKESSEGTTIRLLKWKNY